MTGGVGSITSVFFGGSDGVGGVAGRILAKSDAVLVVATPRGDAVGAADVTLVTPAIRVTRDDGYTFLAPSITNVTPNSAPTSGGRSSRSPASASVSSSRTSPVARRW